MVLPSALAHSVDSAPFAFQTHGPCLQVLPCSELGPKVLELVAKSLASAQTEMGARETGPWSVVGQDPLQGCRGHECQSVLVYYLPSFYSLNDSQRISFSSTTDTQAFKEKKATLDHTNDTPIWYSQYIIFKSFYLAQNFLNTLNQQSLKGQTLLNFTHIFYPKSFFENSVLQVNYQMGKDVFFMYGHDFAL